MSIYHLNFEKHSVMYVAQLSLMNYGIVDFVERFDYLQALDGFNDLVDEANDDRFGEGVYEVLLMKEFSDSKGRLVKSERLRRKVIDRGDEL